MKRLKLIWNSIWSAFLGRQESKYHREILDLSYEQMLDGLTEVNRSLPDVTTAKHRIIQLVAQAREKSEKLFVDAGRFLEAGNEQSAQQTLARKALVDQQVLELETRAASIAERQVALEANQRELQTRIEGFKAEKEMIKARHAAAKATAQIGETVTGIAKDGREAQKAVGRITEATEQLEARGDALSELIQSGALEDAFNPGQSPLDRQALEMARDDAVQADLEKLRKQIGNGKGAPSEIERSAS